MDHRSDEARGRTEDDYPRTGLKPLGVQGSGDMGDARPAGREELVEIVGVPASC